MDLRYAGMLQRVNQGRLMCCPEDSLAEGYEVCTTSWYTARVGYACEGFASFIATLKRIKTEKCAYLHAPYHNGIAVSLICGGPSGQPVATN